uniref:Interleukin-17F n=1 Tax=Strongyloides venezuelensis TaxID=75913 RepID=A0A0K0FPI9_STRVS
MVLQKRVDDKISQVDISPYCTGTNRSLKDILLEWFLESNTIRDKEESVMEIDDNYRNYYVVPEPKICSQPLENRINSNVNGRSLCPYEYKINFDIDREPKYIKETVCLCKKSRSHPNINCYPIKREMPVLKKVLCDITGERYEYVKAVQSITVGCHSALPRIQRPQQARKTFKFTDHDRMDI